MCPSSCTFLSLPTVSIHKNIQHQLNIDCWVEVQIRMPFQFNILLSTAVVQTVLKNSRCCKEVFLGVTMVVKMLVADVTTPRPVSSRAASVLLWASIVFIQGASWPQSLSKTNDLRISCSQNAEIQKIGHRNQKLCEQSLW